MCDDLGTEFSSDIDTSNTGDFSDGLDTASDASFSDEIEDIPEDDFEDDMVDVSDDLPEDDFSDNMVDVSDDLPEDDCEDDMVDVSDDLPEDDFKDNMVDVSDDIPEDEIVDDMQDVSDDIPEDEIADDMEDISDDIPEDETADDMQDVSDDIPEDEIVDDMKDVSDDIPENETADAMEDISDDVPDNIMTDNSNNILGNKFSNDTSLASMSDQELGNFTEWENAYASEIDNIRNDPTLSDLEKSALLESSYNEFVESNGINNYSDADIEDGGPVKVLTYKSNRYYNDDESVDLSNDFATDTAPRSSLDSREYTEIVDALDNMNVEYRPIAEADTNRTEQDIIDRISGGDETEGSCSSLALAYAGNKGGYDVLDYRDGNSREYFATRSSIEDIAHIPGVESFVLNGTNDFESVSQLLSGVKDGEEYYLASGQHAAIIRHNNNQFEYLELQHQSDGNGWHSLNNDILKCRFGCESDRLIPSKSYMMNVSSLSKNNEFKNILGYINTAEQDQMKGTKGYVR